MEHKLRYTSPARYFEEALPLGNGTLGAMIYGDSGKDKIALNHDTLWSGKPRNYRLPKAKQAYEEARECILQGDVAGATRRIEKDFTAPFGQNYLPLGNLYIETKNALSTVEYCRELDMQKGLARVCYTTERGRTNKEYFVSNPDRCVCVKICAENTCDYSLYFDCQLRFETQAEGNTLRLIGQAPSMLAPAYAKHLVPTVYDDEGIRFAAIANVFSDGVITPTENGLLIMQAKELVLYLCMETSYQGFDKKADKDAVGLCQGYLNALNGKSYEDILLAHTRDFSSLYDRVEMDLGFAMPNKPTDERLRSFDGTNDLGLVELLFNFGRYLLISSSRLGSQAANLQGIWNEEFFAPWSSNYTVNINTQMNYWPVFSCGLEELNEPLVSLVKKISVTGEQTARDFYGAKGFCSHHNVDLWGMSTPVGAGNEHSSVYAFWNGSSGWLCRHLWEQYEYTLDKEFLQNTAYPLMKKAAEFYLSIMLEHGGKQIVCPSTSPENFYYLNNDEYFAVAKYTTMTQAIVYDLFDNLLKASRVLGISDDFTQKIEAHLPSLLTYAIGKHGQLLEYDQDYREYDEKHRHTSHLYGLYPGESITVESTPTIARACRVSLERRGDETTGWAMGWRVNLWAKLKDGERAFSMIKKQLSLVEAGGKEIGMQGGGTYPNMLDAHPPFQIDGNFGVCAGIAQLLLQCENGKIHLLPALPTALKSGRITGLKAKGNIRVDIVWENGRLRSYSLLSPFSQAVRIATPNGEEWVSLSAGKKITRKGKEL